MWCLVVVVVVVLVVALGGVLVLVVVVGGCALVGEGCLMVGLLGDTSHNHQGPRQGSQSPSLSSSCSGTVQEHATRVHDTNPSSKICVF